MAPVIEASADFGPMMCTSFLSSPLETILESLDDHDFEYVSLHDIIEAYAVLSTKIRSCCRMIFQADQHLPALSPLKEHASSLAQALRRDIRRAIVDCSPHLRSSPSLYGSCDTDILLSDHDIQTTRDLSTVCHHSLRVLSDVFAFKTLYSLFPPQDLQDLFHDIMMIALATTLPTLNASKTWSFVFWTIQSQNLPATILSTRKDGIVKALRHGLNGEKGPQAKLDSFKAIHSLLKSQPELFVSSLLSFLPTVLENLVSEDDAYRLQAAHSLSGFALAKVHLLGSTQFPHEVISQSIHVFIKAHSPSAPRQGELYLSDIFTRAFSSGASEKDPFWAIIVTSSMIVLSDHHLFLRSSLKFCAVNLRPALTHKNAEIQALHTPAWRTLIWAFSRLPVDRTWSKAEDPDIPDENLGVRGKAFRILKQELQTGKGVSLVRALLRPSSGSDADKARVGNVSRALLIIRALVNSNLCSNIRNGILLLQRLVSAIGTPGNGAGTQTGGLDDTLEVTMGLFDGTLLEATTDRVKDAVHSLAQVKIDDIRQLSEEELVFHWDVLVKTWIDSVEKNLGGPSRSSRELLNIWQSLLLAQARLTQEHGDLSASSSFAGQIAGIVRRFITESEEAGTQVRRLIMVKQLWGVMKNVYSHSWLPAESILANVIRIKFSLENESVRAAWSHLCADLISVGVPSLLHVIIARSDNGEGQEVTRQLWAVLARFWQVSGDDAHWEELASFLGTPFKAWVLSDAEFKLWEATLKIAVSLADSTSTPPTTVVIRILQRLGQKELDVIISSPKEVAALLAYINLSGSTTLPTQLLDVVDRTLTFNYPPQPEKLAACLEILHVLARVICTTPTPLLVRLLCVMEKSLCCWIGDEKETMLGSEHEAILKALYCAPLDLLQDLPRSLETLIAISPFLSSAFGRLTPSAAGPLAFGKFWRATYHGVEEYRLSYPDSLKACLLGLADAFGGSIADGLSMNGPSQVTAMSTIPDSQPSNRGCDGTFSLSHYLTGLSPLLPQNRSLTPTPTKRRRIEQLEDYSSVNEEDRSRSKTPRPEHTPLVQPPSRHLSASRPVIPSLDDCLFGLSTPQSAAQETGSTKYIFSSGRKRSSSISELQSRSQSQKRRKANPQIASVEAQAMTRRHSDSQFSQSSPVPPSSPLEPFGSPPSESYTQNTDTRKRKRIINWVSLSINMENSIPRVEEFESQLNRSGPSTPEVLKTRPSTPSSVEYDSWEAGASMHEIMQLRRELVGSDNLVPDTDRGEVDEMGETDPISDPEDNRNILQDLALSETSSRHQQQQRSQTAPSALPQRHQERPTPLRRHQTTSARIDALQRAYSFVANGASQIPVEDLVHATGLANRIQSALTDQLTRRLAGPGTAGSGHKPK